jgi:hypothetical protein
MPPAGNLDGLLRPKVSPTGTDAGSVTGLYGLPLGQYVDQPIWGLLPFAIPAWHTTSGIANPTPAKAVTYQ